VPSTYTIRFLTQHRSVPSILNWNSAFWAKLCFRAENQINKYLSSSYCLSSTGGECKGIQHQPSSQITCCVGVINGKTQGIDNFLNSSKSQKRFKMFEADHQRNGTCSALLLKKSRALWYLRLKRSRWGLSGEVGWGMQLSPNDRITEMTAQICFPSVPLGSVLRWQLFPIFLFMS